MDRSCKLNETLVTPEIGARLPRGFAHIRLLTAATTLIGLCAVVPVRAQQHIIPPKSYTVTPSGINVADGSLVHSVADLSVGPLTLQRSYRTGTTQPNNPPFGKNFSHNFDIYIASTQPPPPTTHRYPTVYMGGRASGLYSQSMSTPSSIYTFNMDAERGQLSWNGSQYIYVDNSNGSGTVYTFSATVQAVGVPWASSSRKVERIDFADGRRQSFSYNASGYLKLVEDSSGFAMVFDYDANGDVVAACAFNRAHTYVNASSTCSGAALKTTYTYTSTPTGPYLATVTDVLNQVTTYTNAYQGVTCIKPPGYTTCTMSMNGGARITTHTLQDGGTWTIAGMTPDQLNDPEITPEEDGNNVVTVTDPNNVTITLAFTKTSPYTMTDANNNVTHFRYQGAHRNNDTSNIYSDGTFLMEAIYPEGNKYQAEYLGPFRSITREIFVPKPGSGLSNLVKDYGYGSCSGPTGSYQNCAKPIWIKDPKGNQTDFGYALHGGLAWEMQPAPTAGAPRPLKIYNYVQKYAYIRNSGGALVAAATPMWMLSSMTQCQTAAGTSTPACDTGAGAPQTVTSYQYGADGTAGNLLVRGVVVTAGGQSRRTCYGYDVYARKISETRPNANLGVCP